MPAVTRSGGLCSGDRAQRARLAYTARSQAAAASLAENYVGASRPWAGNGAP